MNLQSASHVSQPHWEARARPRRSPLGDERLRDALAGELLGVCLSGLRSCGVSDRTLKKLAPSMVGKQSDTPVTDKMLADMYWMGELSNRWGEDPAYLDSGGRPQVLRIHGSGATLESLVKVYFGKRSVDDVVQLGCARRVMDRIGRDKVARSSRCVMFTGDPCLLLAHSVRSVRWFLANAQSNSCRGEESRDSWPERAAFAPVSPRDFEEFVRVMRPQIAHLIDMADRWLGERSREHRSPRAAKKVMAGVQAYVFRE